MPKSNVKFWMDKWSKNVKRDIRNEAAWREAGWNVVIVWGCAALSPRKRGRRRWSASAGRLKRGPRNSPPGRCVACRIGWNFRIKGSAVESVMNAFTCTGSYVIMILYGIKQTENRKY